MNTQEQDLRDLFLPVMYKLSINSATNEEELRKKFSIIMIRPVLAPDSKRHIYLLTKKKAALVAIFHGEENLFTVSMDPNPHYIYNSDLYARFSELYSPK